MSESTVVTSKFYMFRCLIAVAHADGVICEAEMAYMSAFFNRLPFSDEQLKTFENDFIQPQPVGALLAHINEPKFRSQVLYFARLMAYKDGELHPSEDALLKKIHADITDGLDMDSLRAEAQQVIEQEINIHDIKIDQMRPTKHGHIIPWAQWLDEVLLSLGIDLMKD